LQHVKYAEAHLLGNGLGRGWGHVLGEVGRGFGEFLPVGLHLVVVRVLVPKGRFYTLSN